MGRAVGGIRYTRGAVIERVNMFKEHNEEWEVFIAQGFLQRVPTEELIRWARRQELDADVRVRHIPSGEWVDGLELASLLREEMCRNKDERGATSSAATAAARLVADAPNVRLSAPSTGTTGGAALSCASVVSHLWTMLYGAVSVIGAAVVRWPFTLFAAPLHALLRWATGWKRWVACTVALCAVLGGISWMFMASASPEERALASYQSLLRDYQRLQQAGATPKQSEEWQVFVTGAHSTNRQHLDNLRRRAGADNRAAQQLLWAGRDVLPRLLSANGDSADAEAEFVAHLHKAEALLQGTDASDKKADMPTEERMRSALLAAESAESRIAIARAQKERSSRMREQSREHASDRIAMAFLAADALILLTIVTLWWYRVRR